MNITQVKVFPVHEEKLKAFVSVVFDHSFMVNDIKVIQGKDGLFLSMPSRRKKNGEFKDVAHPLNNETRRMLEEQVLAEYRQVVDDPTPRRPDRQPGAAPAPPPAAPASAAAAPAPAAAAPAPAAAAPAPAPAATSPAAPPPGLRMVGARLGVCRISRARRRGLPLLWSCSICGPRRQRDRHRCRGIVVSLRRRSPGLRGHRPRLPCRRPRVARRSWQALRSCAIGCEGPR